MRTENQTVNFYDPYGQQNLTLYKTFYWRIVTRDSQGETSDSGVWEFTTGINDPPTEPQIDGPTVGPPGEEFEFHYFRCR